MAPTAARSVSLIETQSEWVTAIRYYRGHDASTAGDHLGTKKPVTTTAVALALTGVAVAVVGALVLLSAIT